MDHILSLETIVRFYSEIAARVLRGRSTEIFIDREIWLLFTYPRRRISFELHAITLSAPTTFEPLSIPIDDYKRASHLTA